MVLRQLKTEPIVIRLFQAEGAKWVKSYVCQDGNMNVSVIEHANADGTRHISLSGINSKKPPSEYVQREVLWMLGAEGAKEIKGGILAPDTVHYLAQR